MDLSSMNGRVRQEWEELKVHDILYLLSIQPPENAAPVVCFYFLYIY